MNKRTKAKVLSRMLAAVSLGVCATAAVASDRTTVCETVQACLDNPRCSESFSEKDINRMKGIAKGCPKKKKAPGPIVDI